MKYSLKNIGFCVLALCCLYGTVLSDGDAITSWVPSHDGFSPLHYAAFRNDTDAISFYLEMGVAIDSRDEWGLTPFLWALTEGGMESAKLLLERGADSTLHNNYGSSSLHLASTRECVEFLIAHGADCNARNEDGLTPLHQAAGQDRKDIVRVLIDAGADVNLAGFSGLTPLQYVLESGNLSMARLLIECGADVNTRFTNGYYALHHAIWHADVELGLFFIAKGACVDLINDTEALEEFDLRSKELRTFLFQHGINYSDYWDTF